MRAFVSSPVDLPPAAESRQFSRADLVFYGVDARNASYSARIFLDQVGAEPDTSPSREMGYAGSFNIFGHGGCFGDEGHCEVPDEPPDPFDTRPPHPLTPQTKIVDISAALKATEGGQIVVTAIVVVPGQEAADTADELTFASLRLLVYV
jgi:hypothetical protein